ncbi:Putative disease resistance RGA3 [Gossypium arboreum]|uniref:Putative disease resistance RGA3 n=1 Tax=Gossypium arboreum TaxID=29729 RepID=A0A0B0PCC6_GOSAR|nr:Putative disease resistance RGA3 [Gossypium arboreum]
MRCLTNLQILEIGGISQLEERCRKDIGADWQKIAHIPKIRLYNELGRMHEAVAAQPEGHDRAEFKSSN